MYKLKHPERDTIVVLKIVYVPKADGLILVVYEVNLS